MAIINARRLLAVLAVAGAALGIGSSSRTTPGVAADKSVTTSTATPPEDAKPAEAKIVVADAGARTRTETAALRDASVADTGEAFMADFRKMNGRYKPGASFNYVLPPGAEKVFNLFYTDQKRPMRMYDGRLETPSPYSVALTVKGRHAAQGGHHEGVGWHKFQMRVRSPRGVLNTIDAYVQSSAVKGLAIRDDGKVSVVGGAMISKKTLNRMGINATYDIPDCAPGDRPSGRYVTFRDPRPPGYVPPPKRHYNGPARPKHQYRFVPTNICPPTAPSATCEGPVRRHKASLMGSVSHLRMG